MTYRHTVANIDEQMNIAGVVNAQTSAIKWSSNSASTTYALSASTSNMLFSNTAPVATWASNTSSWTSNNQRRVYATGSVKINSTWFGQPVFSKSYSIAPYITDSIIDGTMTSLSNTLVNLGGSAMFSNKSVPIPSGPVSAHSNLNVTPYFTSNGLACTTSIPLDRLDIWIDYTQARYNTV